MARHADAFIALPGITDSSEVSSSIHLQHTHSKLKLFPNSFNQKPTTQKRMDWSKDHLFDGLIQNFELEIKNFQFKILKALIPS